MIDELVESLLYEGYALYPYTPGATKNATPTPFGIVYPPAYADECEGAFDHARLECLASSGSAVRATIRWLVPSGERHEAVEQRVELEPVTPGGRTTVERPGARFTLRFDKDMTVRCCVHNTARVKAGLDRATALLSSLISTHVVIRVSDGTVHLAARERARERQHLARAGHRRRRRDARRGDRAAGPSPDRAGRATGTCSTTPRSRRRWCARARAQRRGARSGGTRDPAVSEMLERALASDPRRSSAFTAGSRRFQRIGGARRTAVGDVATSRAAERDRRRRRVRAGRARSCCARGSIAIRMTGCSTGVARRSSESISTTTTGCTSR